MLRKELIVDCSEFEKEVDANADTLTKMMEYARYAINKELNRDLTKVCIRVCSADLPYPELKLKPYELSRHYKSYMLVSVDLVRSIVYLEGEADYRQITQPNNQYNNAYIVSFFDLKPVKLNDHSYAR